MVTYLIALLIIYNFIITLLANYICSYTCNDGYRFDDPSGSKTLDITCGSNGNWSDLGHQCISKKTMAHPLNHMFLVLRYIADRNALLGLKLD